jgi:hypothetical protein
MFNSFDDEDGFWNNHTSIGFPSLPDRIDQPAASDMCGVCPLQGATDVPGDALSSRLRSGFMNRSPVLRFTTVVIAPTKAFAFTSTGVPLIDWLMSEIAAVPSVAWLACAHQSNRDITIASGINFLIFFG